MVTARAHGDSERPGRLQPRLGGRVPHRRELIVGSGGRRVHVLSIQWQARYDTHPRHRKCLPLLSERRVIRSEEGTRQCERAVLQNTTSAGRLRMFPRESKEPVRLLEGDLDVLYREPGLAEPRSYTAVQTCRRA